MKEDQHSKSSGRSTPELSTPDVSTPDIPASAHVDSLLASFSRVIRHGLLGEQLADGPPPPLHTLMQSPLGWDDLIVTEAAREQLGELRNWLRHEQTLRQEWKLGELMRSGIGALFQGPRGTGKALAATVLGQETSREVHRVDCTGLGGRYIGETEKNLDLLFEQAGRRRWILFFDEADALLGKRTEVKDSHDRYANLETNYLLQRMENFHGLVILSFNTNSSPGEAITARIHSLIQFRLPDRDQRRAIWLRLLPESGQSRELIEALVEHELSGENIRNVAQFAAIAAIADGRKEIEVADLITGIRRELEKGGGQLKPA
jgi:SpoVK/Ycf46/Vps4 family AAA+-type ATPase